MFYRLILIFLMSLLPLAAVEKTETAIFAGGCFWCMEGIFESQEGVS